MPNKILPSTGKGVGLQETLILYFSKWIYYQTALEIVYLSLYPQVYRVLSSPLEKCLFAVDDNEKTHN